MRDEIQLMFPSWHALTVFVGGSAPMGSAPIIPRSSLLRDPTRGRVTMIYHVYKDSLLNKAVSTEWSVNMSLYF